MSIPLVQNNEKDSINTSIIAIKRNIERINMLLGLVDNDSPDLSGFATKQELQDAVTELQPVDEVTADNMQSVTSNAVAELVTYDELEETFTGYWGSTKKKIYKKIVFNTMPSVINQWKDIFVIPNGAVIMVDVYADISMSPNESYYAKLSSVFATVAIYNSVTVRIALSNQTYVNKGLYCIVYYVKD